MKYTWVQYDDVITKAQCKQLIEAGKTNGLYDAKINDEGTDKPDYYDPDVRNCQLAKIPFQQLLWMEDLLSEALSEINFSNYNFDLVGFSDLQMIEYNKGTYFKRHLDNFLGEMEYQRKITFIIQLTDPDEYVGGDLVVYTHEDEEIMTRKQGSLIVFPSYTMHEVREVLSGTRHSIIGWVLGPDFK